MRVSRFDRETLLGYVNPLTFQRQNGIELLTTGGDATLLPYAEVKSVAFVRDFGGQEPAAERKTFSTRPKMNGLWLRVTFRDGDVMEGILPNDLLHLESHGFTVIPPDPYSNNQRIFLPRAALTGVQVLGVVGSPLKQIRKPKPAAEGQIGLFEQQP